MTALEFLVLSKGHGLLPIYHRLRRTGHNTKLVIWNSRLESSWAGLVEPDLKRDRDGLTKESLLPFIDNAKSGNTVVVTDVPTASEWFAEAEWLYGVGPSHGEAPADSVLFGGWYTGDKVNNLHLLVPDWGAWVGGQGPQVMGGLTLVRSDVSWDPIAAAVERAASKMLEARFKGLFYFDVVEEPETGALVLHRLRTGWTPIHMHAFLAELEGLNSLLLLGSPPALNKRFVTVVPVSQPPWPNPRQGHRRPAVEVTGLTPNQVGACFWQDIVADPTTKKIHTAGHDGLVAVATGSADSGPLLARVRALELAMRIELPEKQYRSDAGLRVEQALGALEDRWGLVL